MLKLSIKSINKPVKLSTAWPLVLTASGQINFDNCLLSFVEDFLIEALK